MSTSYIQERFPVGCVVRNSGSVVQRARDEWQACGREPNKSRYKEHFEHVRDERGTVTAHLPGDPSRGVSPGVEVTWADGHVSRCLTSRVEPA